MDRVIKAHFDGFRAKGSLPAELNKGEFEGIKLFPNQAPLERWRNWRTGLEYRDGDGSVLSGALDDLLVKGDRYLPFDYKTKGSVTTEQDAVKYYQNQLDCYALLLDENQMPTAGYGFLLYYSPKTVRENGAVSFELQAIRIATDPERARATFRKAAALLKSDSLPAVPAPLRWDGKTQRTPAAFVGRPERASRDCKTAPKLEVWGPAVGGSCEYCAWLAKFR